MELKALHQVAQKYRDEGYEVILEPRGDAVPSFLSGFQPDLVARRGDEGVVAEVTYKRIELADDAQLSSMAERINDQPGWRLDVIVLEHETMADRAMHAGAEPEDEQIGPMIEAAERMAASGFLPFAYVAALSSLEAVMRNVCKNAELYPHRSTMDYLGNLYSLDLLGRKQFIALREAFKVRSQIVHGLVPPPLDAEAIHFVTATAKYLLYGIEKAGPPPEPR